MNIGRRLRTIERSTRFVWQTHHSVTDDTHTSHHITLILYSVQCR